MSFSKRSLWGGWIVFAVAFVTYMLTLEPTNSLWDCSEFIATSYKLEVGHPPGTPFFFLINRFAAMFGGPEQASFLINSMSALESALTIAFLFWSIAHLGRRLYRKEESELDNGQGWGILAAAAIGSLAYTFSDTFWFSAVEAEVYALSSLFTAVVFWAILKWENVADQPGSNRWLVLIAYLMGLSIGAHILNLLAIPALVFIYYFKKFPGRKKSDLWKPGVISVLLTGAFYILTPTVVSMGAWVDRVFVNGFGAAPNTGLVVFILLLVAGLVWGIYRTYQAGRAMWNTVLLSALMVVIGFSTYGVVLIRASVNPPMNSNNPSNPYALRSFLNREQYGSRPLFKGESYASTAVGYKYSKSYYFDGQKYLPTERMVGHEYDPATTMLFPRMYSPSATHKAEYQRWADIKGKRVRDAEGTMVTVPTFAENLRFFFAYQVNNMYWRYFLWNFVGRQSDLQNENIINGNVLSGIRPIDELFLGPQDNLPAEMARNKGRNVYFFLPLILGLIGFFFQLKRDGRNFLVVFLLFFMTGLAIILYLNQTPLQPRERDYAYAGSFYAFTIWIGLGALWVYDWFQRKVFKNNAKIAAAVALLICLPAPAIMAAQNWDDHDRSGRAIARDMGYDYLVSTLPNSIIINYGDNDTFPLWYNQEVEGVRTDVRVMNSQYITGDWYIDQMRQWSYLSAPIPHSMPRSKYAGNAPGQFFVRDVPKPTPWTIQEVMEVVNSDDPRTKVMAVSGTAYDFIPARRIAVPVDKDKVIASGIVREEDRHLIEDTIYLNLEQEALLAGDMVFLDLLACNNWERPIYFTSYSGALDFGLVVIDDKEAYSYLQQDGIAYRLVPIKSPIEGRNVGRIDVDYLYDNLMNKFRYGNISDPDVYVETFATNSFGASQMRQNFARLADGLTERGDSLKAIEVVDRAMQEMPLEQLRVDDYVTSLVESYYKAGAWEKGDALALKVANLQGEYVDYFDRFKGRKLELVRNNLGERLRSLYHLYEVLEFYHRDEPLKVVASYLEDPNKK